MKLGERQRQLDALLSEFRPFWHPQPFRDPVPAWACHWPALARTLESLSDDEVAKLNDDSPAALDLVARHCPEVIGLVPLMHLPQRTTRPLPVQGQFWDWEIPGRKRAQIEAFVAAIEPAQQPALDWCSGKGHLGRLLALAWQVPVHSLERDAALCEAGRALADRAGVPQSFVQADALACAAWPKRGEHAVALHACGHLHRRLVQRATEVGAAGLDIAPCCYHLGVTESYRPLSPGTQLELTRDDLRLAVTETVTAKSRETRLRDRGLAWKLGFDAYRRRSGHDEYRTFKPVPEGWLRGSFFEFMQHMTLREGLPPLALAHADEFEAIGWRRHREVMHFSVVRHAFRRALEVWLALDLARYLEQSGFAVTLGTFCERTLTPRNLLLSARR